MSLRVIKTGLLDTIQDRGRFGYQHLGINPGGVMDQLSARQANLLVGNDTDEAVIELHFPASEFCFEQPALIALAGGDFIACINGDRIPILQPVIVSKYSILQFYHMKSGARAYLAVHGGLGIPKWFDSFSTNLKAMAGGYKGRALQKDDMIDIHSFTAFSSLVGKKEFLVLPWKTNSYHSNIDEELLLLQGNEWEQLTTESKEKLSSGTFVITNQSDRMGYCLNGAPLSLHTNEELISSAVCFGTIQLQPDGQLIVLMADHQTTGGYPRVAHIISADHGKLAQMKAGETIRFRMTDLPAAEKILLKQQQHLLQLQNACKFKVEELLHAYH